MNSLSVINVLKAHPAPLSIQKLADAMGIERAEARRQLKELIEAGSVSLFTVGKETRYRPNDHHYSEVESATTEDSAEKPKAAPIDPEQLLARQVDELNQRLAIAEKDRDKQAGIATEALQLCQEQLDRLSKLECTASALGFAPSAGIPLFEWLESMLPALAYELAFLQDLQNQLAQARNLNRGLCLALELKPEERAALAKCITSADEQKDAKYLHDQANCLGALPPYNHDRLP
ncbi:helix-turn-helix domain-containing protein [Chromobacterium sp.]|uniref:helix-turn-helix domain-containing protein n=1 Tax=Chromobacterium sp. TaxID=306190 RepID=UPI0035B07C7E